MVNKRTTENVNLKDLQSDIKRAFASWGLWTGAAGMVIAILIGAAGDILPVFEQGAKDGLQSGFHAQMLLRSLLSDVMLLCVPILAALPYTSAFLDDNKSGYLKEYLPRSGKGRYIKGKVAATALSGGCIRHGGELHRSKARYKGREQIRAVRRAACDRPAVCKNGDRYIFINICIDCGHIIWYLFYKLNITFWCL